MKKIHLALLGLFTIAGLASCGGKNPAPTPPTPTPSGEYIQTKEIIKLDDQGTPTGGIRYTYNAEGKVIKEHPLGYDASTKKVVEKDFHKAFVYKDGLLREEQGYTLNGGTTPVLSNKVVYTYQGRKLVLEESYSVDLATKRSELAGHVEYTWEGDRKKEAKVFTDNSFGASGLTLTKKYRYENGLEIEDCYKADAPDIKSFSYESRYDAQGRLLHWGFIQWKQEEDNQGNFTGKYIEQEHYTTVNEYDARGNFTKVTSQVSLRGVAEPADIHTYTYSDPDAKGNPRKASITHTTSDGKSYSPSSETYSYTYAKR